MQSSSRAPLLSATLSRVSCWIICRAPTPRSSSRLLHHLDHAPALVPGDRARFHDPDQVSDPALVLLVVRLELDAVLHHLLVQRVRLAVGDLDDDGLLHLVRDHAAEPHLAEGALLLDGARLLLRVRHSDSSLAARRRRLLRGDSSDFVSGWPGASTFSGVSS